MSLLSCLFVRTVRVPQGVAQHLPRPGFGVHGLDLYARFGHGPERRRLPVRLRALLPHDRVELVVVLVAKHEAHVVVVDVGVHEERALEVDAAERVVTCGGRRKYVVRGAAEFKFFFY